MSNIVNSMLLTTFNASAYGTCTLWLDAMNPAGNATQPADNTAMSSWVDLSGSGNTVTQGIGANQPLFKLNILNGKPVIRFNGTSSSMAKVTATAMGATNTFFIVGTVNNNGSNRGVFFDYSTNLATNTGTNFLIENGPNFQAGFYDGVLHTALGGIVTLPQSGVFTIYNDGVNGFIQKKYSTNIASIATGNTNNTGTRVYTLGALEPLTATYFLNGDIAEVLFFSTLLSPSYQAAVVSYLAGKWGF